MGDFRQDPPLLLHMLVASPAFTLTAIVGASNAPAFSRFAWFGYPPYTSVGIRPIDVSSVPSVDWIILERRVERMKKRMFLMALGGLFPVAMIAQSGTVTASARAGIDAGNQAWIDGVKTANIALISATYAEDAVDCGPAGECFRGRLQIEQHMRTQLTNLGRARAAAVQTWGSSQQSNFVYEWGRRRRPSTAARGWWIII
jgi:hypothetical protein